MIYIYLFLFIIGSILGSFYAVVGTRRPLEKSIIRPASHCEYCNHILKWYELIPIVSYLIQGGKCRSCNAKLPPMYIIIEILSGLLFVVSFYIFGFSYKTLILFVIASLLIIIYVSDFKYYIILDGPLIISFILILLIKGYFLGLKEVGISLITGLLTFTLLYLIKIFGDKAFKRESLGGGDIKLGAIIGATVGFLPSVFSLAVASFLALPYACFLIIRNKEEEMPFGPFLISALYLMYIYLEPFQNLFAILLV